MHQPTADPFNIFDLRQEFKMRKAKDFRFGSCNRYGHESLLSGAALAGEQTRNAGNFSRSARKGALIVEVEVGPVASIKVKGDDGTSRKPPKMSSAMNS